MRLCSALSIAVALGKVSTDTTEAFTVIHAFGRHHSITTLSGWENDDFLGSLSSNPQPQTTPNAGSPPPPPPIVDAEILYQQQQQQPVQQASTFPPLHPAQQQQQQLPPPPPQSLSSPPSEPYVAPPSFEQLAASLLNEPPAGLQNVQNVQPPPQAGYPPPQAGYPPPQAGYPPVDPNNPNPYAGYPPPPPQGYPPVDPNNPYAAYPPPAYYPPPQQQQQQQEFSSPPRQQNPTDGKRVGRNRDADQISNTADLYFAQLKLDTKIRKKAFHDGDQDKFNQIFEDERVAKLAESLASNPHIQAERRNSEEEQRKLQEMLSTVDDELSNPNLPRRASRQERKTDGRSSGVSYRDLLKQRKNGPRPQQHSSLPVQEADVNVPEQQQQDAYSQQQQSVQQDPYSQQQQPVQQDPYSQQPVQEDLYPQQPVQQDPYYSQQPVQQDPYYSQQQQPVQQDPYYSQQQQPVQQDPYSQQPDQQDPYYSQQQQPVQQDPGDVPPSYYPQQPM